MGGRAARNVGLATPLLVQMDEDTVSAIDLRENLIDRMEVEDLQLSGAPGGPGAGR